MALILILLLVSHGGIGKPYRAHKAPHHHHHHARTFDDSGFTLIELLVVILIIGILAAISIPTFIKQIDKANDAGAKSEVYSAQVVAGGLSTEQGGRYEGLTPAYLHEQEPTIEDVAGKHSYISKAEPIEEATGYTVTATAPGGDDFTYTLTGTGEVKRTCTPVGRGGCPSSGSW